MILVCRMVVVFCIIIQFLQLVQQIVQGMSWTGITNSFTNFSYHKGVWELSWADNFAVTF